MALAELDRSVLWRILLHTDRMEDVLSLALTAQHFYNQLCPTLVGNGTDEQCVLQRIFTNILGTQLVALLSKRPTPIYAEFFNISPEATSTYLPDRTPFQCLIAHYYKYMPSRFGLCPDILNAILKYHCPALVERFLHIPHRDLLLYTGTPSYAYVGCTFDTNGRLKLPHDSLIQRTRLAADMQFVRTITSDNKSPEEMERVLTTRRQLRAIQDHIGVTADRRYITTKELSNSFMDLFAVNESGALTPLCTLDGKETQFRLRNNNCIELKAPLGTDTLCFRPDRRNSVRWVLQRGARSCVERFAKGCHELVLQIREHGSPAAVRSL